MNTIDLLPEPPVTWPQPDLATILTAIEKFCDDEWAGDLEADLHLYNTLDERMAECARRLERIYIIAHAFNPNHSCHGSHDSWRKEAMAPDAELQRLQAVCLEHERTIGAQATEMAKLRAAAQIKEWK